MSLRNLIFLVIALTAQYIPSAVGQEWKSVKGTKLCGISGMALIGQTGKQTQYLAVHDNKQLGEPRLAIITDEIGAAPRYESIAWPDSNPPIDAEAISALPGSDNSFVVMSSGGKMFHIKLDLGTKTVRVIQNFIFPYVPQGSNYEGLSFQKVNGNLLAIWGHRGQDNKPGVIYWGMFDPATYTFSSTGSDTIKTPWPGEGIRHISDLRLDPLGVLYIVSSSDMGDDGPFQSAFYVAGLFSTWDKEVMFRKSRVMHRMMKFDYHKIEAMEFVPGADGGIIFGSDDENMGGWIYTTW